MFDMFNEDSASNSNSSYSSDSSTSNNPQLFDVDKTHVISVGGSVFIKDDISASKIKSFCELINKFNGQGHRFIIVIGGGFTCRKYQNIAKELDFNNFELDKLGILVTRANANLFLKSIKNAHQNVLTSIDDLKQILQNNTPVFGGLSPGQTTDAVATLAAEMIGCEFINLSNVDGIFDKDPKEDENAVLFEKLSFNDLNFLLREKELLPGQHLFLDKQAASILTRSKIKGVFLNGEHLEDLENYLSGNSFRGTIVSEIEDTFEIEKPAELKEIQEHVVSESIQENQDDEEIDPRKIDFGK